jgi:hypothetical protein
MTNLAHNSALYANCSLLDSFRLPVSTADDFFQGDAFKGWKKSRESNTLIQVAVVERLNSVVAAINVVVKAIGQLGNAIMQAVARRR